MQLAVADDEHVLAGALADEALRVEQHRLLVAVVRRLLVGEDRHRVVADGLRVAHRDVRVVVRERRRLDADALLERRRRRGTRPRATRRWRRAPGSTWRPRPSRPSRRTRSAAGSRTRACCRARTRSAPRRSRPSCTGSSCRRSAPSGTAGRCGRAGGRSPARRRSCTRARPRRRPGRSAACASARASSRRATAPSCRRTRSSRRGRPSTWRCLPDARKATILADRRGRDRRPARSHDRGAPNTCDHSAATAARRSRCGPASTRACGAPVSRTWCCSRRYSR